MQVRNAAVSAQGVLGIFRVNLNALFGRHLALFHGLFAQALLKARLLDVLDLSVHPFIAGSGGLLFHEDQAAAMKLTATKTFSNIVKLTYEPQYDRS